MSQEETKIRSQGKNTNVSHNVCVDVVSIVHESNTREKQREKLFIVRHPTLIVEHPHSFVTP